MKPLSISSLLPATAIAVGMTAIVSQPSYAYDSEYADINSEDWSYSDRRVRLPEMDWNARNPVPTYHYAYYYIARPEYLL